MSHRVLRVATHTPRLLNPRGLWLTLSASWNVFITSATMRLRSVPQVIVMIYGDTFWGNPKSE